MQELTIDGSLLEGGGQIVRLAVALSSIISKPIKVVNIRSNRPNPGLKLQHLVAMKLATNITDAYTKNIYLGSEKILFSPKTINSGKYSVKIESAGSTNLVLQTLMPILMFSNNQSHITLEGGTNNPWAPTTEFMKELLFPTLKKMGFNSEIMLNRRGFYPSGKGSVKTVLNPVNSLKPLNATSWQNIRNIRCFVYSCRLPSKIVNNLSKIVETRLLKKGLHNIKINVQSLQPTDSLCSVDPGIGISLFADVDEFVISETIIGRKGLSFEKIGKEVVDKLTKQLESQSPIDKYLGDQIILYIALAKGRSKIKISEFTLHTKTCIEITEKFLGIDFEIDGKIGESATITCDGIGYSNKFTKYYIS